MFRFFGGLIKAYALWRGLWAQSVLYTPLYLHNDPARDTVWLWSFAQLTDVHIGEAQGDYGTPGYEDSLAGNLGGYAVDRLRSALAWLRQQAQAEKLAFVLVTGDLTDSGERSELLHFKALMDSSGLLYLPIPGNHDIWPYVTASEEAPYPYGDSLIAALFAPVYAHFAAQMDAWEGPLLPPRVWNPEASCPSLFYTFAFRYRGVRFIAMDGISRQPAPLGQAGVGPDANLHDFPGGAIRRLDTLLQGPQPYPMVFFCHYPLINSPLSGVNSFSPSEYDQIISLLYPHQDKVLAWIAGHIHRDASYPLYHRPSGTSFSQGIETPANKDGVNGGQFRIYRVYGESPVASLHQGASPCPCVQEDRIWEYRLRCGRGIFTLWDGLGRCIAQWSGETTLHVRPGVYYLRDEQTGQSWRILVP